MIKEANNSEIIYSHNVLRRFKFDFYNEEIQPDLITKDYYIFFDLDNFQKKLETIFNDTMNRYPKMFKYMKEDLINYSEKEQKNEFVQKQLNKKTAFFRAIYFFFKPSERNENELNKVKKIAFWISQLNAQKIKRVDCKYIGLLDKNVLKKFIFEENHIYDNIDKTLNSLQSINNNDNYIRDLFKLFTQLRLAIDTKVCEDDEKVKYINYLYFFYFIKGKIKALIEFIDITFF